MARQDSLSSKNLQIAKRRYGYLSNTLKQALQQITAHTGLSASNGDLLLLQGKWYVTHAGLLSIARRKRCCGINVQPATKLCDAARLRWAFKATVYTSPACKGFVGFGDADPSNVSPLMRGAEMRVAETRAVNRALRKAYGIGLCSVEEIGPSERYRAAASGIERVTDAIPPRDSSPRLRDRLLLLIRQFGLEGEQVKRFALAFCGTATLRDASREQVEKLVNHLATVAAEGQARLSEQLAPYAQPRNQGREEEAA